MSRTENRPTVERRRSPSRGHGRASFPPEHVEGSHARARPRPRSTRRWARVGGRFRHRRSSFSTLGRPRQVVSQARHPLITSHAGRPAWHPRTGCSSRYCSARRMAYWTTPQVMRASASGPSTRLPDQPRNSSVVRAMRPSRQRRPGLQQEKGKSCSAAEQARRRWAEVPARVGRRWW